MCAHTKCQGPGEYGGKAIGKGGRREKIINSKDQILYQILSTPFIEPPLKYLEFDLSVAEFLEIKK